ncbi:MAG TPA: DUF255 domain-containing protein, partial [Chitinophagaceae bacterium]|nr:DUF255 domain-containing protein [Chitinophagaceae bacterium]
TGSWAATLQKAQKENKLIFVDTYFTGCHPCAQMDKDVFPNEMVSKELQDNFIGIKVDVFKEKLGDTINMKYGISGFPTFLILEKNGKLISMFSGYNDPGRLLLELNDAKQKAVGKQFLSGFAATYTDYPAFYKRYYDREARKVDPAAASAWILEQKDWTKEQVALPLLRMNKLGLEIDEYFIKKYAAYRNMYGKLLVFDKASGVLSARMRTAVDKQKNEAAFRQFLDANSKSFPAEDWKIFRFLLGFEYYGGIAKDTVSLLQFINEEPVAYMNYLGSLYNNMLVKKQLDQTTLNLLCNWVNKTVTIESPIDIIRVAASLHKQNNDKEGYRRFVNMALEKSRKYRMPTEGFEKMLASE